MKHILIRMIKMYQLIPGSFHNYCKHVPSCSNYAIEAIDKHGTIKGSILATKRILKCSPWGTLGYDPVPPRRSE
jgi:putative membrane protein insertion efficiency factor